MDIPIEKVSEAHDRREKVIEDLSASIDLLADKLRKSCRGNANGETIYLETGKVNIQLVFGPRMKYEFIFHWSRFGGASGCHTLTRKDKSLNSLLEFADLVTPTMIDNIIDQIESQTEQLETATKLLAVLS